MEVITKPLYWSAVESLAKRDDGVINNPLHMDRWGILAGGLRTSRFPAVFFLNFNNLFLL